MAGLASELKDVRRQARGQATRIRLRALREAADLGGRMTELARRPESRERLLDSLQTAIARRFRPRSVSIRSPLVKSRPDAGSRDRSGDG